MADKEKPDEAFDRPSRITGSGNEPDQLGLPRPGLTPFEETRFPAPPSVGKMPDAPQMSVKLPPRPDRPRQGTVAPGGYHKLAVSVTAASSFVTPILVLGVGGWYLDQMMHHQTAYLAFGGTVLGFVLGVFALMRIIKQLSK